MRDAYAVAFNALVDEYVADPYAARLLCELFDQARAGTERKNASVMSRITEKLNALPTTNVAEDLPNTGGYQHETVRVGFTVSDPDDVQAHASAQQR